MSLLQHKWAACSLFTKNGEMLILARAHLCAGRLLLLDVLQGLRRGQQHRDPG